MNSSPGKLIRNLVDEVGHTCSVVYNLLIIFREFLILSIVIILLSIYNEIIIFPILIFLGLIVIFLFRKIKKIIKVRGTQALNKRGKINVKATELIEVLKKLK